MKSDREDKRVQNWKLSFPITASHNPGFICADLQNVEIQQNRTQNGKE